MTKPVGRKKFRLFAERTNLLITLAILGGVGLYVWSESANDSFWKSVLAGLASAVLALGLVTFASEFFLKRAFTEDVLQISNLKHDVYNAGILGVIDENEAQWIEVLGATRSVKVVALRPSRWQSTLWPYIRKAASSNPVDVQVVFLEPGSDAATKMAARLGQTLESYSDEVRRVATDVEKEWKREKERPEWRSTSSSLEILASNNMPNHSLVRVDGKTCLLAEPMLGDVGTQTVMCLTFRDMAGESFPQRWLLAGLDDVLNDCSAPLYSDKSVKNKERSE